MVGEIIEANTARFVAQCPRALLHEPPQFGTFVRVLSGNAPPPVTTHAASALTDDPFADPIPFPVAGLPPGTPDDTLYALVGLAATSSAEPGRRPAAYGLTETELRAQQPQIFDLLATTFSAVHVGYARQERFQPHLPPRPPRLHAFVTECSPQEVIAITETPDFLRFLLSASHEVNPDELIAASLRHAFACRSEDFPFLVRSGKQLALLLRDEPDRLSALLRKLSP